MTEDSAQQLRLRFHLQRREFELDVELSLPATGVTGLVGASGSGKTSLLRCIAGLERDPRGYLRFRDRLWQDGAHSVPAYRRAIGYVVQGPSLFPHLSVRKNLRFGEQRVPAAERRIGFDRAVALLGLDALLERKPDKLSGGEQQRVAIARALLTSPELLLLDEPLTGLDLESRGLIIAYFERLQAELQIPIVYVSHEPREVSRLASRIVLLERGRVRAHGPLHEMLTRPDLPLSHFDDAGCVLDAIVVAHEPEFFLTYVGIAGGRLAISARDRSLGTRTRVHVRARDVSLSLRAPLQTSIMNVLAVKLLDIHPEPDPAQRLVRLACGDDVLLARVTQRSVVELGLVAGMSLYAQVKSVALVE
jgi:molybdate transport system ATP-binding protein